MPYDYGIRLEYMIIRIRLLAIFAFIIALLMSAGCDQKKSEIKEEIDLFTEEMTFNWKLDSINLKEGLSFISIELINNGIDTLKDNWALYFNHLQTGTDPSTLPSSMSIKRINGTFFSLSPTDDFIALAPSNSYKFDFLLKGMIFRKSDAPTGVYLVKDGDTPKTLVDANILGVNNETLKELALESPSTRYNDNKKYEKKNLDITKSIIPAPKSVTSGNGTLTISGSIGISANSTLDKEVDWAQYLLSQCHSGAISKSQDGIITLQLNETNSENTESYTLDVDESGINITSGTPTGIFNGISTLAQLIDHSYYANPGNELQIPYVSISDTPGYGYRGIMLDVSRYFHSVESVKKLLDIMAFYKLNNFHFHLGDDEGWRVEIDGLPELTEYGGKRGHTLDESEYLQPAYGSGPHHEPEDSYGSGWYTKAEYIDILRYAADRHIEVIPEMDMPGHARAAIYAMEYRYRNYMKTGNKEEAERYLLSDPNDNSKYSSAQGYNDNSFCACRESTYDFVEKVVDEIVALHEESGTPLKTFHTGGDEVGYGSWHESPICQNFIKASTESVSHTDDLQPYFTARYKNILDKHGLNAGGWEEFVLKSSSEGHHGKQLNPNFIGQNMRPYVWNATWGWGREDMAYKLANVGYEVVMCNSAQLYFDLAYNMDPEENGLMWSGMVDSKSPFFLIPEDIYNMPYKKNSLGVQVSDDLFTEHTRLTEEGKGNILGIQGHLWSETITNQERIEYYVFPKALSLAERAWNPNPSWASISKREDLISEMEADWGMFSQKLGGHQMKILDHIFEGVGYRIPLPGAIIDDGKVLANSRFEGLEIRFTTDGSEPNQQSTLYQAPFELKDDSSTIRIKAFASNGRTSRESVLRK